MTSRSKGRLLVFHSAYTFKNIKARNLEIYVTSKDAGMYFNSVLTVSAVASIQHEPIDSLQFGKPISYQLDDRNTIIEGKLGRFKSFKKFKKINFFLSQNSLVITLLRLGKLGEVKVVFADDPSFNGLYGYFFSRILRKPLIVGVWGNPGRIREIQGVPLMPRLYPSIFLEELVEKFVLGRADLVLVQNAENGGYPLSAGVDPKKIKVLPLGIGIHNAHFLDAKSRMPISKDLRIFGIEKQLILTCISRLEKLKMVDHAILACNILKDAGLDFKLIIIGDGRERQYLSNLVKDLNLEKHIIFAGNRNQEWLAGFLSHVDLAIAPLTGRALLEIGLAGCPVVAYDVDWHNEIVQPNVSGILVKNLDYEGLGKAALKLLQNKKLRIEYGKRMLILAKDKSDVNKLIKLQTEIYGTLTRKGLRTNPGH